MQNFDIPQLSPAFSVLRQAPDCRNVADFNNATDVGDF